MGEVYLVRHPRLPRYGALKILRAEISADADYRGRFDPEADWAGGLRWRGSNVHENVGKALLQLAVVQV
jgi:hypothetical protein